MKRLLGTVFIIFIFVQASALAQDTARTYETPEQRLLDGDPRYIVLHDGPADYGRKLPTTSDGATPVCYVCDDKADETDEPAVETQPEQTGP